MTKTKLFAFKKRPQKYSLPFRARDLKTKHAVELLARMSRDQLNEFSIELVESFPNLAETLSSNFEAYLEDRAVLSGRHDPEGAE